MKKVTVFWLFLCYQQANAMLKTFAHNRITQQPPSLISQHQSVLSTTQKESTTLNAELIKNNHKIRPSSNSSVAEALFIRVQHRHTPMEYLIHS